ncbi:small RNA degrading nuclease 5-like isoform X2 [Actinia tenebrosa]|uniref:Small RNA degrading nuclease 5-like isoform X2 n=1 Tax=Actinia tenebrosa TaxID=6105 RepID=A0A6P8HNH5_ACTTE|nr:small RNA degrading nuclease 5-like isoform X2 [Actinia tenebrosa]
MVKYLQKRRKRANQAKRAMEKVVPTNASGTDFTFQHAHETLLSVPLSKSQLKKKMKKSRDKINDNETLEKIHEDGCSSNKESYPSRGDKDLPAVPVDKSVFLLTKDQLKSNKYPVRCYDEAANDEDGFLPCITRDSPTNGNSEEQPVFAVDCEMCVTSEGHELTRISIVDESMNMLYDTLVKPGRPILDYKTKYSGITAEILEGVTVTLQDVQKQVTALLPTGAILAGHSLDCDLNALKMYHNKVIDTAVAYKDKRGGYFKPSLKFLAEFYLQKKIQKGSDGHCSIEDAKTCMELVKLKFREGPTFGLAGNASEGLFDKMDSEKKTCSMLDYPYIANLCRSGGHNVVPCTSDSEIVLKAANLINSSDFTWIHLQAVQHFYERLKDKAMNEEQKEEVLKELDTRVREIYQDIPDDCLTLVIMGCGDIREIIRLQRDPSPRTEELRKAVQEAKKGLCFMKFT